MSLDNLGNEQTIILHNCEINNEKHELVITPHTQSIGYIGTKRQTITRKVLSKQRQITRKRFSKRGDTVSESETSNLEELYRLNDSVNENYQFIDTIYFSDSETTSPSSIQGKRRINETYKNKPVRLHNWNQPIKHIENYKLIVIKHKNESK